MLKYDITKMSCFMRMYGHKAIKLLRFLTHLWTQTLWTTVVKACLWGSGSMLSCKIFRGVSCSVKMSTCNIIKMSCSTRIDQCRSPSCRTLQPFTNSRSLECLFSQLFVDERSLKCRTSRGFRDVRAPNCRTRWGLENAMSLIWNVLSALLNACCLKSALQNNVPLQGKWSHASSFYAFINAISLKCRVSTGLVNARSPKYRILWGLMGERSLKSCLSWWLLNAS